MRITIEGHRPCRIATESFDSEAVLIRIIADVSFSRRRSLARHNGNAPRFTEARASHDMARQERLGDRRARKLTATQRNDNGPSS